MRTWLFGKIAGEIFNGLDVKPTISGLRTKTFWQAGRPYIGIEQNPKTNSQWARLAQQGQKVVQFKDLFKNQYVAVSVNGKVTLYRSQSEVDNVRPVTNITGLARAKGCS